MVAEIEEFTSVWTAWVRKRFGWGSLRNPHENMFHSLHLMNEDTGFYP